MADENVNDVNENDEQGCAGQDDDCCGGDLSSKGGSNFKGLLFLIVLILAGAVVANSIINKNKTDGCVGGVCPDGAVTANACDKHKAAMSDKTAAGPNSETSMVCDINKPAGCSTTGVVAACPSTVAKPEKKACCPSMAK